MRFFTKGPDGGATSGVTGYWLIEWKRGFSVVLLRFGEGTREAYHSHAFHAVTLWLRGSVTEHIPGPTCNKCTPYKAGQWKLTKRSTMHKVNSHGVSWALSFRGPWTNTWQENRGGEIVTLSPGRVVV